MSTRAKYSLAAVVAMGGVGGILSALSSKSAGFAAFGVGAAIGLCNLRDYYLACTGPRVADMQLDASAASPVETSQVVPGRRQAWGV